MAAGRSEACGGSVCPFLDVACGNETCRAFANVRRVYLRQVALGVVEMPHLLLCVGCGLAMPALASWRDAAQDAYEEENMPKITRHGGPTNAAEREHPGTGVPTEPVEAPADGTEHELTGDGSGEALPPADEPDEQAVRPAARRRSRKAGGGADSSLEVTAEAEVTRGASS
ncbi:hypothetical protein [Streptosporangium sp. NPDC002607]